MSKQYIQDLRIYESVLRNEIATKISTLLNDSDKRIYHCEVHMQGPNYNPKRETSLFNLTYTLHLSFPQGTLENTKRIRIFIRRNKLFYTDYEVDASVRVENSEIPTNIKQKVEMIVFPELNRVARKELRKQFVEYTAKRRIEILPIPDLANLVLDYTFIECLNTKSIVLMENKQQNIR